MASPAPRPALVHLALLGLFLLALVGCVVSNLSTTPRASVFAVTGVAAVAADREVTGDCWSTCPYDGVCNHETGLCEAEKPGLDGGKLDAGDAGAGDAAGDVVGD